MPSPWLPVAALLELLLPSRCAGCSRPGAPLCPACAALGPRPGRTVLSGGLVVWHAGDLEGPLAGLLRSFKARGVRAALPPLTALLQEALRNASGAGVAWRAVPVPGTLRGYRRRGFRPVPTLLSRLPDAEVVPLLRLSRQPRDQRQLVAARRHANLGGAMAVHPPALHRLGHRSVVLVDDVLTTGATLGEAERVLRDAGVPVLSAAVVAKTPLRWHRAGSAPPPPDRHRRAGQGIPSCAGLS